MPPTNQRHSKFGRRNREIDITFDPNDFKPVTPYSDELKDGYHDAQETLLELRQREELIRRKAELLEEVTQKEEEFFQTRDELIDQFEEYLEILDREALASEKLGDQCSATHQRFLHHLSGLENLNPDKADRQNFVRELDMAFRHLEAAEVEIDNAMPLLNHLSNRKTASLPGIKKPIVPSDNQIPNADFAYWLKAGFAFTLPLMMLVVAIAIALFFLR